MVVIIDGKVVANIKIVRPENDIGFGVLSL